VQAQKSKSRRGQALIELAAGLVVILVLVAGLLQIGILSRAHLDVVDLARERAGRRALGEWYGTAAPPPVFLRNWSQGTDGRPYTRDDLPLRGNPAAVRDGIVRFGAPAALRVLAPGNAFSAAMDEDPLVTHFGLVGAREESLPIPLLPAVRTLIYRADSITLEATAWSVRLDGLE
jgi:hypothetical protein